MGTIRGAGIFFNARHDTVAVCRMGRHHDLGIAPWDHEPDRGRNAAFRLPSSGMPGALQPEGCTPELRFMGSTHLQLWTRIGTMNQPELSQGFKAFKDQSLIRGRYESMGKPSRFMGRQAAEGRRGPDLRGASIERVSLSLVRGSPGLPDKARSWNASTSMNCDEALRSERIEETSAGEKSSAFLQGAAKAEMPASLRPSRKNASRVSALLSAAGTARRSRPYGTKRRRGRTSPRRLSNPNRTPPAVPPQSNRQGLSQAFTRPLRELMRGAGVPLP